MMSYFLFVYSIMAYGISVAFVYFNGPFNIIGKFRDWMSSKHETFNELFSCMFCLPTNIGIILSIASLAFMPFPITPFTLLYDYRYGMWPIIIMLDAFYTGGIVYLIHTLQERLERSIGNE